MTRLRLFVPVLFALGMVPHAAAQTTFVQDTFTVAANTLLEAHTPNTGGAWTRVTGGSGITLNAAADNARNVAATDWNVYANGTTSPNAEIVVGMNVTFTNNNANNFANLFGRGSVSLLNAYEARLGANGNVQIIRYAGGAPTVLTTTTTTVSLNVAHTLIFSIKNASKEVWLDGVLVASSTNNTLTGTGLVGLGMNSSVAAQNITDSFFASTFAPTAVDRLDATAVRDGGRTLVEWTTAREARNLGFRVYRDGVRVSPGLIAGGAFLASGALLPAGNTYRFIDENVNGRVYAIEEVDLSGRTRTHGPIVPARGVIDRRVAASPLLSDLGQRNGVAAATRLRPKAAAQTSAGRRRAVDISATLTEKQWQLAADGNALKISVAEEGVVRIPRLDGLDHLYTGGAEVPTIVDGDSLLFYGQPLDSPAAAARVYWLAGAPTAPLAMRSAPSPDAPATSRRGFTATAERRDKAIFLAATRDAEGDGFVGPVVSTDATHPTVQTLRLQHIDAAQSAELTVSLQGAGDEGTAHRVSVSLNGQSLGTMEFDGAQAPVQSFDIPVSLLAEGDNNIALAAQNGDADASAVVAVSVEYAHTFAADDDRLVAVVEGGKQTSIAGFTSSAVEVLDITDPTAPIRIAPFAFAGGTATFTAPSGGDRTILAVSKTRIVQPVSSVRNQPSSLHAAANADEIIVTHPDFAAALAPLVHLRQSQGLSVLVASTEDIYDEFNFGEKDPRAIRAFLAQKRPRYALLVGDASFDERNVLGFGNFDFVPTKLVVSDLLKTASDSWLVDFDNDGAADLPIGRLPVRTLDDAKIEIGKIVTYETTGAPASRSIMFVSDADAQLDFHAGSLAAQQSVPAGFSVVDVDAAHSGAVAAHQQLLDLFDNSLIINYVGHGSVETWSNNALFGRGDIAALSHSEKPPIVIAMTCLNGYFHDVYTESLAEALLRAPNGAVAVWASSALTSPDAQLPADESLLRGLLAPDGPRIGDAVVAAQRASTTPDIRKTFLLFGDPAMTVR